MGFGKYTKDERKIVEKISKLLQSKVYHGNMMYMNQCEIDRLIAKLGGKYQVKNENKN